MSLLNGYGKTLALTANTPVLVTLNEENTAFFANRMTIKNAGTASVRFRVNLTVDAYNSTKTKAMYLAANEFFTCVGDGFPPISKIVVEAIDGPATVYINAF